MKRRDFVRGGSVAGVASLVGMGCGTDPSVGPAVQTAPRLNWRLTSSFPRSLDTIFGAADVLAARVAQLTDDRFRIRVFPAGELVPYDQVFESVQKGTVPMGHSASYYFTGINAALAFDCTVPFGMTARQFNAWYYHGEGRSLLRELFAGFNIVNLAGGNTGTQMGGWFRRPIDGLAGLRGLKMRIPGMGGRVMDRLGVTAQVLAGGEIYPALERGTIDATEWSGPYDDEKLGFFEVAKNYYYPGWWEPGPNLSFYVNLDAWNGLPPAYQAALEAAAAEANVGMMASYDAKNPPALERLLQKDVVLRRFPDDVMQAARTHTAELLEAEASADPVYDRIYRSYVAFQSASNRWFATAEGSLASFMQKP